MLFLDVEVIYRVLGVMSGTSLDGLDLALCEFSQQKNGFNYNIIKAITVSYPETIENRLRNATSLKVFDFVKLHSDFGKFIAEKINENFSDYSIDYIASHGHTVLHYPEKDVNFQIGDGARIATNTGIAVVCDFRSNDIALGGQGAPLVPGGEKFLFPDYNVFLNLGGFSNISFHSEDKITAFDISPANYALNYFARKLGMPFDRDGLAGRKGKINENLLEELNALPFYSQEGSKSLSDHWFYAEFLPVCEKYDIGINDLLRTVYEHIAVQIGNVLEKYGAKEVLVTGGGAFNSFLLERLRVHTKAKIIVPDKEIVNYKEAVIFALLGLLRVLNRNNVRSDVTGSKADNCGGAIYLPYGKL